MKQFVSFVIKETKHISCDKRTMPILFGMPVVIMLLSLALMRFSKRLE